ncbi:hypothetical protein LQV63_21690 [Paenibacillus profundus]|uniref:Lipoprotein n=1 Tax=Paenibacillus profundus TaxID=1173085 RepID=A0ABS8YL31_9BACL|nr:hypothetical protein [Paenibacillus profundus]MCE5171897.1 hypothetical protein [Paenibacillus profundus]
MIIYLSNIKGGETIKKKPIAVLLALLLLALSITGCSSSNTWTESLEQKIAALEKENAEFKEDLAKNAGGQKANADDKTFTEELPSAKAPGADNKVIEVNKAKEITDFAELTIKGAKFATKIEPPKSNSFYSYYEVKDASNTYFDVVIKVKSLLTVGKSADDFVSVKVMYDDKYEYNAFSVIEKDGGGDFTYTNITRIEPLKAGTFIS